MIVYTNVLGKFYFNDKLKLDKEELFNFDESIRNALKYNEQNEKISEKENIAILTFFSKEKYLEKFRKINLEVTRIKVGESVNEDNYIINSINTIEEITKATNSIATRVKEWYSLFLPELTEKISDNELIIQLIAEKDHKEIMHKLRIEKSLGKIPKKETEPIIKVSRKLVELQKEREELEKYLESVMKNYCPNFLSLTGTLIGAKLFRAAGSLKRLVELPSSTIHLLGAEKALFRHLKSGARPPKYGILLQHPLVNNAKKYEKGKAARILAYKISIAVKVDYFHGEFIGDKLLLEVKKKLESKNKK
ncbi:MAG: NOP5/NOP56 family protein [Candidatus Woesearchaeota archaeon]